MPVLFLGPTVLPMAIVFAPTLRPAFAGQHVALVPDMMTK